MVPETVEVPHVQHKDRFVDVRIATYRQVPTNSNRAEEQRKRHMFNSLIELEEIPAMMQVPTMQEAQKTVEVH